MHDAALVICSLAAVVSLVRGLRTVYRREPLWQLLSGLAFGGAGMMMLLVASQSAHSSTLDLIAVAYSLSFVAYALHVWNVQKRHMAGR